MEESVRGRGVDEEGLVSSFDADVADGLEKVVDVFLIFFVLCVRIGIRSWRQFWLIFNFVLFPVLVFRRFSLGWSRGIGQRKRGVRVGMKQIGVDDTNNSFDQSSEDATLLRRHRANKEEEMLQAIVMTFVSCRGPDSALLQIADPMELTPFFQRWRSCLCG